MMNDWWAGFIEGAATGMSFTLLAFVVLLARLWVKPLRLNSCIFCDRQATILHVGGVKFLPVCPEHAYRYSSLLQED